MTALQRLRPNGVSFNLPGIMRVLVSSALSLHTTLKLLKYLNRWNLPVQSQPPPPTPHLIEHLLGNGHPSRKAVQILVLLTGIN